MDAGLEQRIVLVMGKSVAGSEFQSLGVINISDFFLIRQDR